MANQERKNVMEAFDKIAGEFAQTRRSPWKSLRELDCNEKLALDLGAGNGRNSLAMAEAGASLVVAADLSVEMLKQLQKRNTKFRETIHPVRCDALFLPFRNMSFEIVAYIATIHHIPGKSNRKASIIELARVLIPRGRGVITAWSRIQRRFITQTPDFVIKWLNGGEFGDACIRWGSKAERYYHLFTKNELVMTARIGGLRIIKAYGERVSSKLLPENWVVVVEKE